VTTRAFDILSANTNTKFYICEWLIEPTIGMYSTFEMNKAKMDIILKSV
jgi:hypothetical protein